MPRLLVALTVPKGNLDIDKRPAAFSALGIVKIGGDMRRTPTGGEFDVVVIGSGIGGLATASLLAQRGQRVLVLERHFKLGGFNHAFMRKGFHWDVGLHYVGDMAPGGQSRAVMDTVTRGAVDWTPMPDRFDVVHYPGLTVAQPSSWRRFMAELGELFPAERDNLAAYTEDLKRTEAWLVREFVARALPGPLSRLAWLANPGRDLALETTGSYLSRRFADERLRAVLTSVWGDYATPPSRSAFAIHALITRHYARGGWYPVGGSDALTDAMVAAVTDAGGAALVNHPVTSLIVEGGRVVGVRARRHGKDGGPLEFRAPVVVSDAGARATYGTLLDPDDHPAVAPLARAARALPTGPGYINVYLGLRDSLETLGLAGENHWYFGGFDHDAAFDAALSSPDRLDGMVYLSTPSLKDPAAKRHTAELISLVDPEPFRAWAETEWMRRGPDYADLKGRLAQTMIDRVERELPGFADLVEHVEVSTPLTVTTFAGYASGGFADIAPTPALFAGRGFAARSPVPGLFLTGTDAAAIGITGALMGGVFAAGAVLGPLGTPQLMVGFRRDAKNARAARPPREVRDLEPISGR